MLLHGILTLNEFSFRYARRLEPHSPYLSLQNFYYTSLYFKFVFHYVFKKVTFIVSVLFAWIDEYALAMKLGIHIHIFTISYSIVAIFLLIYYIRVR